MIIEFECPEGYVTNPTRTMRYSWYAVDSFYVRK